MVALSNRRLPDGVVRATSRPTRRSTTSVPGYILLLSALGILTLTALVLAGVASLLGHAAHAAPPVKSAAPRPLFVVAGGAPRTGSTFIFNILRILLRIRDPNTVASSNWMLAKLVPENATVSTYDRIALLRTLSTSVLIKVHTAKQYYDFVGPDHKHKFADEIDLLVTGFRDLRDETVSAFKMFAKNRTEWERPRKWVEMCQALIRRRNSLISEADSRVPIVDIRYEDWRDGGHQEMMHLVRTLASAIPWRYSDDDLRRTLAESQRLRVPDGGEVGHRVDWHLSNLMSPRHISEEQLSDDFVQLGIRAVLREPKCKEWLEKKKYVS